MPRPRKLRRQLRRVNKKLRALGRRVTKSETINAAQTDQLELLGAPVPDFNPDVFSTWCDTVVTEVGVVYPSDDAALSKIIIDAYDAGKKVRVVGTRHCAAGVVTDGKDTAGAPDDANQIVVSLAKYRPSEDAEEWDKIQPKTIDDAEKVVRIPAGMTYLDLYQHIRPQGYFLPNQTAGWFFSIGGTMTTPVHGGVFGADMMNRYAVRFRVMQLDEADDGTIKTIIRVVDESTLTTSGDYHEIRDWRCGFGLLGVITAVEFGHLVKRDNFSMYTLQETIGWNETEFNAAIQAVKNNYVYAEFFIDCRDDTQVTIHQQVFKVEANVEDAPEESKLEGNKDKYALWYSFYNCSFPFGKSLPLIPCNPLWDDTAQKGDFIIGGVNTLLENLTKATPIIANSKITTGMVLDLGPFGYKLYSSITNATMNDGYWVKGAPCAVIMAYYCPAAYAFEFMNAFRGIFRERWEGKLLQPLLARVNQLAEFRYVEIQADGPTLFNLVPGEYIVSEALVLTGYTQSKLNEFFYDIQEAWQKIDYDPDNKALSPEMWPGGVIPAVDPKVPVYPHTGKNFGYHPTGGTYEPFDEDAFNMVNWGTTTDPLLSDFVTRVGNANKVLGDEVLNGLFVTPQSSWFLNA